MGPAKSTCILTKAFLASPMDVQMQVVVLLSLPDNRRGYGHFTQYQNPVWATNALFWL